MKVTASSFCLGEKGVHMNTVSIVVICCLVAVILLLVSLLYFEKTVIKEVFRENYDLKSRLFRLLQEEEARHERILKNHASFDEKCLYDLVRRVENVEKKLDTKSDKSLDISYLNLNTNKKEEK